MIKETMRDLILMIALAIAFIYLIMVAQFENLSSPFIVFFTLPLAFTGGLLLLWASGMELSVVALLGFLVLAGVVVNNGIVFVDYVNQLRANGLGKRSSCTGRSYQVQAYTYDGADNNTCHDYIGSRVRQRG